jgi:DNA replication protein DnaC
MPSPKPPKSPPPSEPPTTQTEIPIPPPPPPDLQTLGLCDVLRALGLEHAAAQLDAATQKAITRNDSPTALLDYLMRLELGAQSEARARLALKRSLIFPLCTLDAFDFNFPKQIDRDLVERAASLDFLHKKTNVVFLGASGVGKTHLANSIGQIACLRGHRVRFTTAADLVNDLVAAQARNTLHKRLVAWAAPELLIVDELGYLSFDARGADLLYQVFNRRYQRASTVVTTNLAFKEWGKIFLNSAAASAIADRLVHNGILIKIAGKSKRSDEEIAS